MKCDVKYHKHTLSITSEKCLTCIYPIGYSAVIVFTILNHMTLKSFKNSVKSFELNGYHGCIRYHVGIIWHTVFI